MRRILVSAALSLGAVGALWGGDDALARFDVVATRPSSASIFIGTVTLTIAPFVRKNVVYSAAYTAKVFPFFYTERGRIWIVVPDDDLSRASRGEPVDFKGRAVNDSGDERKVEGRAMPTGPTAGRLRVRVFISRRISLTYNTTYELQGPGGLPARPIPR